ncbi:hypothetical protein IWW38_000507 [Coemansia aciculifera]|uniref:Uncharacterized protein n=1 Tax=Coemansia aciculifera TaxID=417176 RepID=A0ACC1MAS2_9FUNG|nr:hypothetical protein IWW38_000507 [Coemansia aciculifera]
MVVDHVVDFRPRTHSELDYDEEEDLLTPLLWVCHNFRTVVYSRICRRYELSIHGDYSELNCERLSWPASLDQADYQTRHLVKELDIELDVWSVYSGKSLRTLLSYPYNDLAFPLARSLRFVFVMAPRTKIKPSAFKNAEINIGAFVQQVERMVPMASDIKVETNIYSHGVHPSISHHFASLVSQLCQRSNHAVRCSLYCSVPCWQQSELTRAIVHDDHHNYTPNESTMQLV